MPEYSDHDLLLGLHSKVDHADQAIEDLKDSIDTHDTILVKGKNGRPSVVEDIRGLKGRVKWIIALIVVAVMTMLGQLGTSYRLLVVQETIREIAADSNSTARRAELAAQEAAERSESNQKILERKIVPELKDEK